MANELKYRAICPYCKNAFDVRYYGYNYYGLVVCKDCSKNIKFETYF